VLAADNAKRWKPKRQSSGPDSGDSLIRISDDGRVLSPSSRRRKPAFGILNHSDKRRMRRLARFGASALLAEKSARAYTHVVWLSFASFVYLITPIPDVGWVIVPSLALFGALGLIALFDARYFIIPDKLIVFLLICGALTVLASDGLDPSRIGASGGAYLAMRALALLYERLRGEAGLGHGDAKLFAVAGLWLGFEGLPTSLVLAVFSALLSVAILFRDEALESSRQPIPFGPHLALGFWLTWTVGPLQYG
jgi:leader peptidase (prepilin peptidase)/N-methyltransferase